MSVRRAQLEIDSAEFAEWMAYANLEPFGPVREDQRAGVVASIIANVNRDTSAHPDPFTVDEFFPRYEDVTAEEQTTDEERLKNKLTAWATAMAGNKHVSGPDERPRSELRKKKESGARHEDAEREAGRDGGPDRVSSRGRRRQAPAGQPPAS